MDSPSSLQAAANALASAEALLITTGAGMGVDSGLPDFRGPEGFWNAYPAYRHLGLDFVSMANPRWFREDPALAWGFYGHRMQLYRKTKPHAGFEIFRRWADRLEGQAFVFTSNVDGHFQRSGFADERVVEVHGSIHFAQCLKDCGAPIFPADSIQVTINETTFRAEGELPTCPRCGALARPNILMFSDGGYASDRFEQKQALLGHFLKSCGRNLLVVELGAGTAVPTIRRFSETIVMHQHASLIRINVRESEIPPLPRFHPAGRSPVSISLPMGALAALEEIDRLVQWPQ